MRPDAVVGSRPAQLPLPSGPNGLPRARVTEIQRTRLIAAIVATVDELGYQRATVAEVIIRARVSRKTFYEIFADLEDCFLAAFDDALAQACVLASEAYAQAPGWRHGTRATLGRLLAAIDEQPTLARLCMLETLVAGARVRARRAAVLVQLAELVDRGADVRARSKRPPPLTGVAVVGGVLAVLQARLAEGGDQQVSELLGPLMSMIVLPYLGTRAARAELAKPASPAAPTRHARPTDARTDPLEGLNMRLTYRTIRVLGVIAEQPGASNRDIAESAEIVDQGQISKLLSRLSQHGLVANSGGQGHGRPNAWHLTARGRQLETASGRRL
jgi:DNA-binding MarR family transcriptional regulator